MKSTLQGQLAKKEYRDRMERSIASIIDRGDFIDGHEVRSLEYKMSEVTTRKFAIATSSGTDALVLALHHKINPGSRVAVPAFSFVASASDA